LNKVKFNHFNYDFGLSKRIHYIFVLIKTESFVMLSKMNDFPGSEYGKIRLSGAIFEYIEIFYNRKRKHSSLGNKTPYEFMKINYAA